MPLMSQHFSTIISIHYRVAATLLLAGLTLSGNLVDCLLLQKPHMWIADGTFQLMHMSHDNHAVWVKWAMVAMKKTKKIIPVLTTSPPGCFDVGVSTQRQPWQCSQHLRGPYLRPVLWAKRLVSARAMTVDRKTKALITPSLRGVTAPKLHIWISAQ